MELHPGTIHPLLIEHILENILNLNHGKSDLKIFRLVCRQWNEVSSKVLQLHSRNLITFGKFFRPIATIQDLLQLVEQSSQNSSFPCGNVQLCQDVFQIPHECLIRKFFTTCASVLCSLVIRLDGESTLKINPEMLKGISLPKLKTFVFDDRRNISELSDTNVARCILEASENLATFSLHQESPHGHVALEMDLISYSKGIEDYIDEIIGTVPLSRLRHLQLDIFLNDQVMSILTQKMSRPNKIQRLSLCLRSSQLSTGVLLEFLQCFQRNMKQLKLGGLCRKSNFEIRFPDSLNCLECLEIQGWCGLAPNVRFSELSPASHFPALRKLLLNTWNNEQSWLQLFGIDLCDQIDNNKEGKDLGGLTGLYHLKLPEELINPAVFHNPMKWNSLRSLEIHCTYDTYSLIETVFSSLTQLEELKFLQSRGPCRLTKCIDTLLTGLHSSVCRKLSTLSYEKIKQYNFQFSKPGLTNLTNLKSLDLTEVLKYQANITDTTGYLVFWRMKSLQSLKVTRSKMSYECLSHLAQKYPQDIQPEVDALTDYEIRDVGKQPNRGCLIS